MLPVLNGARTTAKGSATGIVYWASYYVTSTYDSTFLMVFIRIQKGLILYRRLAGPYSKSQCRTFGFWSKAMYPWWIMIILLRNSIWLISELYQILDTPLWTTTKLPTTKVPASWAADHKLDAIWSTKTKSWASRQHSINKWKWYVKLGSSRTRPWKGQEGINKLNEGVTQMLVIPIPASLPSFCQCIPMFSWRVSCEQPTLNKKAPVSFSGDLYDIQASLKSGQILPLWTALKHIGINSCSVGRTSSSASGC